MMGLLSSIVKAVSPVMDTLTTVFVHPIKTVSAAISPTKTIKEVTAEHFAQPLSKQLTETVLTTAGYATAALGAGAIATKGIAATAASLVPATLKGKIIASVAAPVVIGAVVSQPSKTLGAAASLPSGLANVGANVATLAADPSLANLKALVTENPVIVGAAGVAAAGVAAAAVIPAVSGYLTREEMQKQTEAFERQAEAVEKGLSGVAGSQQLIPEKTLATDEGKAITPETTTISTSKKRRKRATIKEKPSVRQNVQVIVSNRAISQGIRIRNERYLNERILA